MEIIKPVVGEIFIKDEYGETIERLSDTLDEDDEFYRHSHGIALQGEHTLCSYACEEWNYDAYAPRKRITCPDCLAVIRHCRAYKL